MSSLKSIYIEVKANNTDNGLYRKDKIMAALEDMGGQATLTVESKLMEWLIKQADLLKLATMINTMMNLQNG